MAGLSDILTTVQQGVVAANGLVSQMTGSLTNISATLTSLSAKFPVSVLNGGTGDTGTAWTEFPPNVVAQTGAFTVATSTGRYKTLGKTCFFRVTVTLTSLGTGTAPIINLPFAAASGAFLGGRETNNNGNGLIGAIVSGSSLVTINYYNNTYSTGSSQIMVLSGVYETA